MPVTQTLTPRASKVLEAMRNAGIVGEAKMADVEKIVALLHMPKGQVADALHELTERKLVKRHAETKAARYYVLP